MKIGSRIKQLRIALGLNQEALARKLGVGQPTISQWEKNNRTPETNALEQIAKALSVSVSELLGENHNVVSITERNLQPKEAVQGRTPAITLASGVPALDGPRDLPILGYVKGGEWAAFIANGESHGMTYRPVELNGVKNAYAVYVHDTSMVPAYEPGNLIHVDPIRPCMPGDDVVIQTRDGQGYIKRLKRRTEKFVICEQWNPPQEVKYPTAEVSEIHLVTGKRNRT